MNCPQCDLPPSSARCKSSGLRMIDCAKIKAASAKPAATPPPLPAEESEYDDERSDPEFL